MRPRLIALCLAAASLLLLCAAPAALAKKASKLPTITRVSPMRIKVGSTLTIRGKNFSSHRTRNTVIFRAGNRTIFVKPKRASRTKLVVKLPASLSRLLGKGSGGTLKATRFKLRVLAGKFGPFTSARLSPVVTPNGSTTPGGSGGSGGQTHGESTGGSGSAGPAPCASGGPNGDPDGDLLTNAQEAQLGTDPCLADSDGDGVPDGYEVQSARDLSHYPGTAPAPYPGKKPYPNALDPTDANTDYDGDGMTLREEYIMWARYSADGVPRTGPPTTLNALLYSDGLQRSVNPPPSAPSDPLANWNSELRNDGVLDDDERDADGDGLGNWDETHGRFTEGWWTAEHDGTIEPKESPYFGINYLDDGDTALGDAMANPDLDGDGIPDGQDDTDHDGLTNAFELRRPDDWQAQAFPTSGPPSNSWAYVNPFNPCKPYASARCNQHPPFGYYSGDEVDPIGPPPPAGYPDSHPATPNG